MDGVLGQTPSQRGQRGQLEGGERSHLRAVAEPVPPHPDPRLRVLVVSHRGREQRTPLHGIGVIRVGGLVLFERRLSLVELPQRHLRRDQRAEQKVGRVDFHRVQPERLGPLVVLPSRVNVCEIVQRVVVVGIEVQHVLIGSNGLVLIPGHEAVVGGDGQITLALRESVATFEGSPERFCPLRRGLSQS